MHRLYIKSLSKCNGRDGIKSYSLIMQLEIKKEMDSRTTADQLSQTLKETVRELEMKLESLSGSSEREINGLGRELAYIEDTSRHSLSEVTAEVT